jgi:hypothetical protein
MSKVIRIAQEFCAAPSGRHPADGDFNGERFREEWLAPPLDAGDTVDVVFDDAEGYGSSFLEEAFGGLISVRGYTKEFLAQRLRLVAKTRAAQRYRRVAQSFIDSAGYPQAPTNPAFRARLAAQRMGRGVGTA